MKVHPAAQGSLEWLMARAGIPTASEFDQLLTPEFKMRTGQMPETYLAKKLAEAWQAGPLPGYNSIDMTFGNILEEEAIPWFELETGLAVERVGLVTTDDGRIGCSPDGLIGDDSGIEIKSPAVHTHTGYLLGGVLPKDHLLQVHGSMFVTGRLSWRFLSYCRGFPPLLLAIEREGPIMTSIGLALEAFLLKFDAGWARLCEINGGPPIRRPAPQPTQELFESEMPS